jgi:hypothetical protein
MLLDMGLSMDAIAAKLGKDLPEIENAIGLASEEIH